LVLKNLEIDKILSHSLETGINFWEQSSEYWEKEGTAFSLMPYLPFFSNCIGYDK